MGECKDTPEEARSGGEAGRFLEELAQATGSSVESLLDAGYAESVPEYLASGKTVRQVASVILSSRRRAEREIHAGQRD